MKKLTARIAASLNMLVTGPVFPVLILALMLRMAFLLWGAAHYFQRADIYTDHDTFAWTNCLKFLITEGTFKLNNDLEYAYFGRMPGYTLFMLPFYGLTWLYLMITGISNPGHALITDTMFPLIAWIQSLLDVITVWFMYQIVLNLFRSKRAALFAAVLYATYPFIIVWNPVCYSETTSVFFATWGLYFLSREMNFRRIFAAGLCLGYAVLLRPQYLLLIAFLPFLFWPVAGFRFPVFVKYLSMLSLGILLTYGWWPLRNYIGYGKIILTQDLRGFQGWNEDVISFMQYIFTVKNGWEPQFHEIIENRKFTIPEGLKLSKTDSIKLNRAVYLSQQCGAGFSEWRGYWKTAHSNDPNGPDCTGEIALLFHQLRESQISNNPTDVYLKLPAGNLKKALFKSSLSKPGASSMLSSALFSYRSLLLVLGMMSSLALLRRRKIFSAQATGTLVIFLVFFITLYVYLCAGTSPQCRNIEMRYFLQVDILLLIPLSVYLSLWTDKLLKKA